MKVIEGGHQMKKKVTLLVVAVMALAAVAASAGTTTIDLNVSVTLPTYLAVTLTDMVSNSSAIAGGALTAAWTATGDPGDGVFATSNQYKLNVVCNDTWTTSIVLTGGVLTRSSGTETLTVEQAHGAAVDPAAFAAMTDESITTSSGDMTSSSGTDSYYKFRVPYTFAQKAGTYTGKIIFTTVAP